MIRVVRTRDVPEVADQADAAEWFMDYRNADGSAAEMCGNGVRVFVAYLLREKLVDGLDWTAGSSPWRPGPAPSRCGVDGEELAVDLGAWQVVGGAAGARRRR